jgi:hypothetical protein
MFCGGLKIVCGSLLLIGLAGAQEPAQTRATASAVSSTPAVEDGGRIKPDAITPFDPSPNGDGVVDPASLLADPPPIPSAKATLVGGTIEKVDRLRDKIAVNVFGGGRMNILFDPRTRVFVARANGTASDLRAGTRIYVDTVLDGTTIFAKTIRIEKAPASGESQGIVLKAEENELTIRDAISPAPLRVRLLSTTRFTQGDRVVSSNLLTPGTLVGVRFDPEGNHDMAREISILALPGADYTFVGQVTYLDLRTGLVVLNSPTDHKTYEIYIDPSVAPDERLRPGVAVTVVANFQGARYVAHSIAIDSNSP